MKYLTILAVLFLAAGAWAVDIQATRGIDPPVPPGSGSGAVNNPTVAEYAQAQYDFGFAWYEEYAIDSELFQIENSIVPTPAEAALDAANLDLGAMVADAFSYPDPTLYLAFYLEISAILHKVALDEAFPYDASEFDLFMRMENDLLVFGLWESCSVFIWHYDSSLGEETNLIKLRGLITERVHQWQLHFLGDFAIFGIHHDLTPWENFIGNGMQYFGQGWVGVI